MLSCVMIDVERGAACVCGLAECAGRRLVVGLAVRLVVLALGCGFGCGLGCRLGWGWGCGLGWGLGYVCTNNTSCF